MRCQSVRGRLRLPSPHTSKVLLNAWRNVKRDTEADCPQRGQKLPVKAVRQFRHTWLSAESGCGVTPLRCHAAKREAWARTIRHAAKAFTFIVLKGFCMS